MTDPAASMLEDHTGDLAAETMPDDASNAMVATEVPTIVVPDRADAPVSEITERFLRAVIAKVPLERIEELHLFSPLRQGGVETGIAVIAARVPVVVPPMDVAPEFALEDEPIDAIDLSDFSESTAELVVPSDEDIMDDEVISTFDDEDADDDADVGTEGDNDVEDVLSHMEAMGDSPYAESDLPESIDMLDEEVVDDEFDDDDTIGHDVVADAVIGAGADDVIHEVPVDAPIERHTVYTARYRLVQKGPERGRWEADVVDEADAPLITVEMVVRGVQRRAGEDSEILRYSARQIARALHMPWPLPPADAPPLA